MTYNIAVNPQAASKYKIAFPSGVVRSESYRSASIGAVEDQLIDALASLRHHAEMANGYPHSSVTYAIGQIEDSLLLLDEVKTKVLGGVSPFSAIGAAPTRALERLSTYHRESADRHILRSAREGKTSWFAPSHWNRLREMDPGLAESLQATAQ
jgi:hypothetical protein